MKKHVGIAVGLTVLICAVFWLYTQWELKTFKDSLPKVPDQHSSKGETLPARQGGPQEASQATENSQKTSSMAVEPSDSGEQAFDATEVPEPSIDDFTDEGFFDGFLETEEALPEAVTSGDTTDVSEPALYDEALVEKGFADYNAYLETDPDYAYQRLDAAFREQYGDDPDVDIVVETVRRSNEGAISVDVAIRHTEAMIRLMSKITPPEGVAPIVDTLEYLRDVKQMALESGDDTVYRFNFNFQVGE